jgi:hypothetical protein
MGGRLWKSKRSQSTVELGLVISVFIGLLLSYIDYAQIFFYKQNIQHAIREAGRFATTGNVLTNSSGPLSSSFVTSTNISRLESVRRVFFSNCLIATNSAFNWSQVVLVSWPGFNNATQAVPNYGPGIQEDYLRIQVVYPIKLISPFSMILIAKDFNPVNAPTSYTTIVESVFVNEKFFFQYVTNYSPSEPLGNLLP